MSDGASTQGGLTWRQRWITKPFLNWYRKQLPPLSDTEREAIDAGERVWTDLLEFYTDDAIYIDPAWGRVEGLDAIREFMIESMLGLEDWLFPVEFTAVSGDEKPRTTLP